MRVFITGATGVIGQRAVPLLIAAGHQVTAVARSAEKRDAMKRQGAIPAEVDLFDEAAVRRAVTGQDVVINVATHIPPPSRMFFTRAWRENDRLRRDASRILADAALAAGAGRFVQESFAPIYEDGGDRWLDEESPVRPVRYNHTVLDAERSAARFTEQGGTGVVLRFAGFYGPDSVHLPEMIKLVRKGRSPLPGPETAYVSMISHTDAAAAVNAAVELPAGVYNVSDDEPLPRGEVAGALANALGAPRPRPLPKFVTVLMGSAGELIARSQRISNRKLRAAGRWAPQHPSVREGFRAVVAALEVGDRPSGS